jgi:hypothetical protein
LFEGEVRVPDIGVGRTFAIVLEQYDTLVSGYAWIDVVRGIQLTEGFSEGQMGVGAEILVGEEDNEVFDEQLIDAIERYQVRFRA